MHTHFFLIGESDTNTDFDFQVSERPRQYLRDLGASGPKNQYTIFKYTRHIKKQPADNLMIALIWDLFAGSFRPEKEGKSLH